MKTFRLYLAALLAMIAYAFLAGPTLAGVPSPGWPWSLQWWAAGWQWLIKGFWPLSASGVAQVFLYLLLPLLCPFWLGGRDKAPHDWRIAYAGRLLGVLTALGVYLGCTGGHWLLVVAQVVVCVVSWLGVLVGQYGHEYDAGGPEECKRCPWMWGLAALTLPLAAGLGLGWLGRVLLGVVVVGITWAIPASAFTWRNVGRAVLLVAGYLLALAALLGYALVVRLSLPYAVDLLPLAPWAASWWQAFGQAALSIVGPLSLIGVIGAAGLLCCPLALLWRGQTLFERLSRFLLAADLTALLLTFPAGEVWWLQSLAMLALLALGGLGILAERRPKVQRLDKASLNRRRAISSVLWGLLVVGAALVPFRSSWVVWFIGTGAAAVVGGVSLGLAGATRSLPREDGGPEPRPHRPETPLERKKKKLERQRTKQQQALAEARRKLEQAEAGRQRHAAERQTAAGEHEAARMELPSLQDKLQRADHVVAERQAQGEPQSESLQKRTELRQRQAELQRLMTEREQQIAQLDKQIADDERAIVPLRQEAAALERDLARLQGEMAGVDKQIRDETAQPQPQQG
ncbi:MAG TPA: hypothetical protein PLJ35_19640 [Anaerolineae bacterium]|nr:hypothetical protein [Anaerolineae bacterium]HOR01035.1 hypothetical protein [Anaerolineae bacterium]